MTPFFAFPPAVRKVVYTTNAIDGSAKPLGKARPWRREPMLGAVPDADRQVAIPTALCEGVVQEVGLR